MLIGKAEETKVGVSSLFSTEILRKFKKAAETTQRTQSGHLELGYSNDSLKFRY